MNNEELIARIEALEKWKADRERQQITFPLDFQSEMIKAIARIEALLKLK